VEGCVVIDSLDADTVTGTVTAMALEVAAVNDPEEKRRVLEPVEVPLIERFVNVATPEAFVVTVDVPPKLPPPLAIATVTATPA
jgi:hypothetical protein